MTLEQAKTFVKRGITIGTTDGDARARDVRENNRGNGVVAVDDTYAVIDPSDGGTSGAV